MYTSHSYTNSFFHRCCCSAGEVAATEAEVDDIVLTQAIDTINRTGRSGRHVKPPQKARLNTEEELVFR
jgi:hypothetical protein